MKVIVRVHSPSGLQFKTRKLEDDGTVVLQKQKKDKAGWRPEVTSVEVKHGWFGRAKFYADIFPEAEKTFRFDYEKLTVDQPVLTRDKVKEFGSWDALRRRAKPPEGYKPNNVAIYLTLIAVVGFGVIQILIANGNLRL